MPTHVPTPSPAAHFPPGEAGAYLARLVATGEHRDWPMIAGGVANAPAAEHARLDAAYRDLDIMVTRAVFTLVRTALPDMGASGVASALDLPAGADPLRVSQALYELAVQGRLSDRPGVLAWGDSLHQDAIDIVRRSPELTHDRTALGLIRLGTPYFWATTDEGSGGQDWAGRSIVFGATLAEVMDEVSLLGDIAAGVPVRTSTLRWSIEAGRTKRLLRELGPQVEAVFERHIAGAPFPVPSLTEADLLMLSSHASPDVRRLAVTLAPLVERPAQPARRGVRGR